MLLPDKTEIKVCKKCKETKSVDDFYRDKKTADRRRAECKKCSVESGMEWARKDKNRTNTYAAKWRKEHREECNIAAKKRRDSHPEEARRKSKKARDANPEYYANKSSQWKKENPEENAAHTAKWKKENPAKVNATNSKRRASKLKACPPWANKFFIEEAYDLAQLRTKVTGFEWHVDHILPLKHKLFCGLHVEYNLQVIPAVENLKKGNRVQL